MAGSDPSQGLWGVGLVLGAPDGAAAPFDVLAAAVRAADVAAAAGCTSLWVAEATAEPPARVPYEAYSLLGALAARSHTVRLGSVADPAQRRAPSMLAKIVTGVDVLSGGRAVLALDGDADRDGDAARLAEALAVARAVLEDDHPTVEGRIYHVDDAVNRPAPVQPGGVPLAVFLRGDGPAVSPLLDVCARAADAVLVSGGPAAVAEAAGRLADGVPDRHRRGARPQVLGRLPGRPGVVAALAGIRAQGADGCLVELPAPWDADGLAAELVW